MAVEQAEVDQAKVDEFMGRLIQDFAGAGAVPLTLIGIRHLRETISTGTSRAYAPVAPVDWEL